ncbi:MAG: hypothetical protein L0Y71_09535 [Gemmataceae bacterium]|nr:hypothetical protein [Gemmataceae bacterium]
MRRKACALLLSATLGGCVSSDHMDSGPHCAGSWGKQPGPPPVPGVAGPHGQRIPMAAPYNVAPPGNLHAARQMMANSVPLDMVQINRGGNAPGMSGTPGGAMPPTPMPPGGVLTPPGVPFAPGIPAGPNITPTSFLPNPGDGVMHAHLPPGAATGGLMLAQYANPQHGHGGHVRFNAQRTQVRFTRPTGMKVSWFAQGADGKPAFSNVPLEAPARYNFPQGAIYRLKLSGIEGRPGLEVYPTMEVVPANPKTEAFLAHSAVPLEFTQDDFKQIAEGNYVTKVIYLPDPQFQDVASTGIDEIISTRLEPGADPVLEALRRGSILMIIRMGNVDQEAPNTPPLGAVAPGGPPPGPPAQQPHLPPNVMLPYPGFMPNTGALPPGGPMMGAPGNPSPRAPFPGAPFAGAPFPGAPGFNPNLVPPPGFNPNLPPPGLAPNAPQIGTALPPPAPPTASGPPNALPPATNLVPPPANSGNIDDATPTNLPPPLPPPVPPAPTPDLKKSPNLKTPGAKAPVINVPQLPPSAPPVPPQLPPAASSKADITVPVAPAPAPARTSDVQSDFTVPPAPIFPGAKAKGQTPAVTPASNTTPAVPALPTIPDLDGPSAAPGFPAIPGAMRSTDPISSPGTTPRPVVPAGGSQIR